jgi:hypothetical protein
MTGRKGKALGSIGGAFEESDIEDNPEPEDPQNEITQVTFDNACSTRAFGAMSDEPILGPDDRTLVALNLKQGIMCFGTGNHVQVGEIWYLLLVMLLLQTTYMIS